MGSSVSATLFWGYCWNDEDALVEVVEQWPDGDWVEHVAAVRGLPVSPWDDGSFPEGKAAVAQWRELRGADIADYLASRQAIRDEFKCDLGEHGHYEAPMSP